MEFLFDFFQYLSDATPLDILKTIIFGIVFANVFCFLLAYTFYLIRLLSKLTRWFYKGILKIEGLFLSKAESLMN